MSASKALRKNPSLQRERITGSAAHLDMRLEALCPRCDPMMLSQLDGFLAGLAVSPEPVRLKEWLPAVLNLEPGENVEALLGPDEAASIAGLLLDRFETTSDEIARGIYIPIIDANSETGEKLWHFWVSGLARAMEFKPGSWDVFAVGGDAARKALKGLRLMIALSRGEVPDDGYGFIFRLAPTLVPIWLESLMYWRVPGGEEDFPETAPLPLTASPGRNDPCPCGSGKKYKKCCYLA